VIALVGLLVIGAAASAAPSRSPAAAPANGLTVNQRNVFRPASGAAPARTPVTVSDETLTDEEVRALAVSNLGRIDVPVTADEWRSLGPRAVPLLEEVVVNRDALPSRRAAALGGLAVIGGGRGQELLIESARSEDEPFAVRAAAIHGVARAVEARRLVKELGPVLEGARDPSARAAAAEALTRRAPRSACAAVRAQADREGEGRMRFERALQRCGAKQ